MVKQGKGDKIAICKRYVKSFSPMLKNTKKSSSWTPCGSATTDYNQAFSIWLSFFRCAGISRGGTTYNYVEADAPVGPRLASKIIMEFLALLQKFILKSCVRPKNLYENLGFVLKTQLPVQARTLQTKILSPSLNISMSVVCL